MDEFIKTIQYNIIKPIPTSIIYNGFINEKKYFIFPGYIKSLRFPTWRKMLNICVHRNASYLFYFQKAAFID